jgi:hypothetical protein
MRLGFVTISLTRSYSEPESLHLPAMIPSVQIDRLAIVAKSLFRRNLILGSEHLPKIRSCRQSLRDNSATTLFTKYIAMYRPI